MLNGAQSLTVLTKQPWLWIPSGLMIVVLVIAINFIGDALRDALDPKLKKPVSKYSLGMRQRLGIAQAVMEDPSILILDEPFNGLDKKGVKQMHELILSLKGERKTILLSSHSQNDIDVLCDTVCEMDAGTMTCIRERAGERDG